MAFQNHNCTPILQFTQYWKNCFGWNDLTTVSIWNISALVLYIMFNQMLPSGSSFVHVWDGNASQLYTIMNQCFHVFNCLIWQKIRTAWDVFFEAIDNYISWNCSQGSSKVQLGVSRPFSSFFPPIGCYAKLLNLFLHLMTSSNWSRILSKV